MRTSNRNLSPHNQSSEEEKSYAGNGDDSKSAESEESHDLPALFSQAIDWGDSLLSDRILLRNARRSCTTERHHVLKFVEEFMRGVDALVEFVKAADVPEELKSRLENLQIPLQNTTGSLGERSGKLEKKEQLVQEIEARLNRIEEEILESREELRSLLIPRGINRDAAKTKIPAGESKGSLTQLLSKAGPNGSSLDDDSISGVSSNTTGPLVRNYYRLLSEMKLISEKLFNFDAEHERQVFIRESHKQQHNSTVVGELKFYDRYFSKREAIIQSYVQLEQEMWGLREECSRDNLDVKEPNLRTGHFSGFFGPCSSQIPHYDLLHQYYFALRDILQCRQQVFKYDADRHDRFTSRKSSVQRENSPATNFTETERKHFEGRAELIKNLSTRKDRLFQLFDECQVAGLEVEPPDLVTDHRTLDQSIRSTGEKMAAHLKRSQVIDSSARVATWLQAVDHESLGSAEPENVKDEMPIETSQNTGNGSPSGDWKGAVDIYFSDLPLNTKEGLSV